MLTKDDLNQIKKIVEPIGKNSTQHSTDISSLKKTAETIKKDVAQTRKDVKALIAYFDRDYEDHLGLTSN